MKAQPNARWIAVVLAVLVAAFFARTSYAVKGGEGPEPKRDPHPKESPTPKEKHDHEWTFGGKEHNNWDHQNDPPVGRDGKPKETPTPKETPSPKEPPAPKEKPDGKD